MLVNETTFLWKMARLVIILQGLVLTCFAIIGVSFIWNFYRQERLTALNKQYHDNSKRRTIDETNINAEGGLPHHDGIKQKANDQVNKNLNTYLNSAHRQNDERTVKDRKVETTPPKAARKFSAIEQKPKQDTKVIKQNTGAVKSDDAKRTLPGTKQTRVPQTNGGANTYQDSYFIDIEQCVPDLDDLFKRTVIVTAISDNHLGEAKGMIASAQRYMPNNRIIVYNIGLSSGLVNKVNKICNVEVRKFPFEKYPPHVRNIHNYAWKPLIILETVKEFGAIFYGDSSVRFLDSLQILYPYLKQNHGFMQHIHNFDPRDREGQYHMTHPDTFRELHVNRSAYANDIGYTPWISAGRVLHVNSSFIHQNVLGPLVECSLRLPCIAPEGAHRGKGNNKGNKHPHRFDSSVLALVVYKYMRGFYNDKTNSTELFDKVVKIERKFFGFKGLKFEPKCDTSLWTWP